VLGCYQNFKKKRRIQREEKGREKGGWIRHGSKKNVSGGWEGVGQRRLYLTKKEGGGG